MKDVIISAKDIHDSDLIIVIQGDNVAVLKDRGNINELKIKRLGQATIIELDNGKRLRYLK